MSEALAPVASPAAATPSAAPTPAASTPTSTQATSAPAATDAAPVAAPDKSEMTMTERRAALDAKRDAVWDKFNSEKPLGHNGGPEIDKELPASDKPAKDAAPGKVKDPVTGKFVSKATEAVPAVDKAADGKPADAKPEAPPPATEPLPPTWSKHMKDVWNRVDPKDRAAIAQESLRDRQNLGELGNQLKAAKPLTDIVAKYNENFRSWGAKSNADAAVMIDGAMQNTILFSRDPIAALNSMAKAHGVDWNAYVSSQIDPNMVPDHPMVATLQAQTTALNRQLQEMATLRASDEERFAAYKENVERYLQGKETEQQQQLTAQQIRSNRAEIDDYAKDKPDFDAHIPAIMDRFQTLKRDNPTAPVRSLIDKAYNDAVWLNPQTRQARIDAEKSAADAKRKADEKAALDLASRASAANVYGAPRAATSRTLTQRRAEIAAQHGLT
jgi:hypothetical protein